MTFGSLSQKLLAAFVGTALLGSSGCVRVMHETRTERGPVLRSFEREVPSDGDGDGGVRAGVEVKYPELTLSFEAFDLCRQERVEEVIEERVTERFVPSAGPAFAMGVTSTLVGGGLLAARGAFSDAPNRREIDLGGRYGQAPRTVATTWGAILLSVGIPALVTGIVGLTQSGEKTEGRRMEQVASSREVPCNLRPVDGEVMLERATPAGPEQISVKTDAGKVTLTAERLRELRLASVHFDGRPVILPEEESFELQGFLACNDLSSPTAAAAEGPALSELPEPQLVAQYNAARRCAQVAPQVGAGPAKALEAEIHRRRGASVKPAGQGPSSFEEAVAAWPPNLRLEPGSDDLSRLDEVDAHVGKVALLKGTLVERLDGNVLLVDVAGRQVWVFIPPDATWSSDFEEGSALDVLGVVVGKQKVGEIHAPLLRAMWIRGSLPS